MISQQRRGFRAMDRDKQAAIASQGGRAAHEKGTAHEFVAGTEEAKEAGRKGGRIAAENRRRRAAAVASEHEAGSTR